jgi:hypothetical protein
MAKPEQNSATKGMTPEFRAAFVNVFDTTKTPNGADRYQLTALFAPGTDLSELKAMAKAALEEKWGTDKSKHPKGLRSPFRKQSEKADQYAGFEADDDAIFINLATTMQPGIVDEKLNDIIKKDEFYSGCYARATVNAYAYDKSGNKGVAFGLNNIQKLRDGERLGGGRGNAKADFEAAAGGGASADSLFDD